LDVGNFARTPHSCPSRMLVRYSFGSHEEAETAGLSALGVGRWVFGR
jgi:hypothetical protein